ncbi:hypothetical protein ACQY0O_005728 [Thecaphora frezii]
MADPNASRPKLSFGFKPAPRPAAASKPSAFGALAQDDVDDDGDGGGDDHGHGEARGSSSAASSSARSRTKASSVAGNLGLMGLAPGKSATPASRSDRKKQQEAEQLDASVFDYDGIYDTIKEAEKKAKQAKQEESAARKPKYIGNFLESAEVRKRDRQRAEAKMIQRERKAEGDEFADKEAFVTTAYKEQQEEIARAEAEEERKEQEQRQNSKGIGSFYRDMLNESSAAREAAIAASLQQPKRDGASASATDGAADDAAKAKSDAELAREAKERGLHVELNDENQIVDKRELLTRGLNVVSKRRQPNASEAHTHEPEHESKRERDERRRQEYESRMNRDAQRSRQSALIEEQMLELERKRKREEEEERERERQKVNARRNDEQAISSARQRYLKRKKKRLEGQAKEQPKDEDAPPAS